MPCSTKAERKKKRDEIAKKVSKMGILGELKKRKKNGAKKEKKQ